MSEKNKDTYKGPTVVKPQKLPPPPPDQANEPAPGSSDASLCSGAGRKAPANDPDVQGTGGTTGFAKLRARCRERLELAKQKDKWSAAWTLIDVLSDIDAIEADAKSGS